MANEAQLGHPQFSEDLALYALGVLDREASAELEKHLEACRVCQRELDELRGNAALLALSTAAAAPPQRARQRLMTAIAREPRERGFETVPVRRPWWNLAPVFASLVLAIFAILLWRDNMQLKQTNEILSDRVTQANQQTAEVREVVDMLRAKDSAQFSLVSAKAHPEPHVKTIYQQRTGRILLVASNLAPIPPNKVYELWLIPPQGAPMPAGLFKPDEHGSAMMMPMGKMLPAGTEAKAFAVTIENEGGTTTPTPPIVLMGAGQ